MAEVDREIASSNVAGRQSAREAQEPPEPDPASSQERYVGAYSWGPGCAFYLCSRATLDLLSILLVIIAAVICICFLTYPMESMSAVTPSMVAIPAGIVAAFILLLLAGRLARRRRWRVLNWRDFEQFRREERQWELVGALAYVSGVITVILGIIGMLSGSQ